MPGEQAEPLDIQIVDLLTDLLHVAGEHGFQPEALLDTAQMHFEVEHAEAGDA